MTVIFIVAFELCITRDRWLRSQQFPILLPILRDYNKATKIATSGTEIYLDKFDGWLLSPGYGTDTITGAFILYLSTTVRAFIGS